MFKDPHFDVYDYDRIPLNEDCFLMDEKYMNEYESAFLNFFDGGEAPNVGYINYISVKSINEHSLELSWFANVHDRFHEIPVSLPKSQLIICVGCRECDEKARLFVKSEWLDHLHARYYSSFAMIDAIGVKKAIQDGSLSKDKLVKLRYSIDELAAKNPEISFISFADNVLLKSNWLAGRSSDDMAYTYKPEMLIYIFQELQSIYKKHLELGIYGIFTQGTNEYYDDNLLHISSSKNHICLNSLGSPFANLMEIDKTVKSCLKNKTHGPFELYMDDFFYHSLQFKFEPEFDIHNTPHCNYTERMTSRNRLYYCRSCLDVINNLRAEYLE